MLDPGLVFIDPRLGRLGARALLPRESAAALLAELGFEELERAAYERLRLTLGVPDGSRDLVVEKSTLLESGFEELNGVDFAKGCFVGQELTARMKYRGGWYASDCCRSPSRARRRRPAPSSAWAERDAGEMRSGIDGQGLALLRLEQVEKAKAEGAPLMAGATEILPQAPAGLAGDG